MAKIRHCVGMVPQEVPSRHRANFGQIAFGNAYLNDSHLSLMRHPARHTNRLLPSAQSPRASSPSCASKLANSLTDVIPFCICGYNVPGSEFASSPPPGGSRKRSLERGHFARAFTCATPRNTPLIPLAGNFTGLGTPNHFPSFRR